MSRTKSLADTEISNVYIYVGDAVRWDYLPQRLRDRGLTVKTVASSIHSPTSFASIFSGRYLPQHQIEYFNDQLSVDSPHLLRSAPESFQSGFANTINEKFVTSESSIIDDTLRAEKVESSIIETIESPFIFVERGPGGHAPYGDHSLTAPEYFEKNAYKSKDRYAMDYQKSIQKDIDHFFDQVQTLEDRGISDDTLIIYTSDHGELLGEDGTLGHNSLIHPSLIYVPTVFIHPMIDRDTDIKQKVFRHVDFLPTVFSLLNLDIPDGVVGEDVSETGFASSGASFYNTNSNLFGHTFSSSYSSVWDHYGGYMYRETRTIGSILNLLSHYKGSKGGYMRRKPHKNIPFFCSRKTIYGSPDLSEKQAIDLLATSKEDTAKDEETMEIDINEDVLRDLGYLD